MGNGADTFFDETGAVSVYSTEDNMAVPDLTLDQASKVVNDISDGLVNLFGIPRVPIEIDGNTTRVKYQRVKTGYKIVIGLKAVQVPKYVFMARLIHELVHVYHDMEFITDTCGNGAYHTDVFSKKAEEWGLKCAWNRSYGFAGSISLTNEFVAQFNDDYKLTLGDYILPVDSALTSKPVKEVKERVAGGGGFKAKIYKIVCPVCNEVFYVQKDTIVTEEAFIAQENAPKKVKVEKPVAAAIADDLMA